MTVLYLCVLQLVFVHVLTAQSLSLHFVYYDNYFAGPSHGVSWPSGLAYHTQVLVLAAECGFESRP